MSTARRWGDLSVDGDARRREVRRLGANGLDGVEVAASGHRLALTFLERPPHHLRPHNVRIDPPPGGRAVSATEVHREREADRELEERLFVELDGPGSSGLYHLRLVEPYGGRPGHEPLRGIDPRFADGWVRFDVEAPLPPVRRAPPGSPAGGGEVSYLQRDFEGLRQLMLDRLAVTVPEWSESHVPDPIITLVELLAYAADDLSYYEDAVATEAYLQTARRRISVRRHGRLVDYRCHDGAAARAWVSVQVKGDVRAPSDQVRFVAAGALAQASPLLDADALSPATAAGLRQFSPLPAQAAEVRWWQTHNTIALWSFGEPSARLVAGARTAALVDGSPTGPRGGEPRRELHLAAGDVIVLEDLGDGVRLADQTRRQAVRLTEVRHRFDELYGQPLLEVGWEPEDALAFELTVTAAGRPCAQARGNVILTASGRPVTETVDLTVTSPVLSQPDVSLLEPFPDPETIAAHQARGLRSLYRAWRQEIGRWLGEAIEGRPLSDAHRRALRELLGDRLLESLALAGEIGDGEGEYGDPGGEQRRLRAELDAVGLAELLARADRLLARRRRRLEQLAVRAQTSGPLPELLLAEVHDDWGAGPSAALSPASPGCWGPAAALRGQDPRRALPVLSLTDPDGATWRPVTDLIGLAAGDRAFVAEIDDQRLVHLRFSAPAAADTVTAEYWIGNGQAGNVEPEAINGLMWSADGAPAADRARIARALGAVTAVSNPLAAAGGADPETTIAAKLAIPGAFLIDQPRALTVADYQAAAARVPGVRAAAAQLRSTGRATVVEVAVAPAAGEDPHELLLDSVSRALQTERRLGHVLHVEAPRYRPLRVAMDVTVDPTAIRATVADALARLLSSGWLTDGTPGLFNPTRLAFAGTVYASPMMAAVHGIAGVQSARLTDLSFIDGRQAAGPAPDSLALGPLELARLDNDPSAPEHGYAVVELAGGR